MITRKILVTTGTIWTLGAIDKSCRNKQAQRDCKEHGAQQVHPDGDIGDRRGWISNHKESHAHRSYQPGTRENANRRQHVVRCRPRQMSFPQGIDERRQMRQQRKGKRGNCD